MNSAGMVMRFIDAVLMNSSLIQFGFNGFEPKIIYFFQ